MSGSLRAGSLREGARVALWPTRGRWALVAAVLTPTLAAAAALLERSAAHTGAADRSLRGGVFGLLLPLLAYALWSRCSGGQRSSDALRVIVRHGAHPLDAALGFCAVPHLLSGLAGGVLGAVAVLSARGLGDPALLQDVVATSWVGALGGVAYAACLGLGTSFGRQGGGRWVVLAADWLLGSSSLWIAAALPRGHLRSLLGGAAAGGLEQWQSSAALAALSLVGFGVTVWRTAR